MSFQATLLGLAVLIVVQSFCVSDGFTVSNNFSGDKPINQSNASQSFINNLLIYSKQFVFKKR